MTLDLVPFRGHTVPVLNGRDEISRLSQQAYLNMLSEWWLSAGFQTQPPFITTYGNRAAEPISASFEGFVSGMLYADGPVASAEGYRLRVFGQAPLLYQELVDGRPGDLFDDDALERLREPWPGGNLGDLMKRSLIYGDFAGNAFVLDFDDELVLVRPDWVEIVLAKREFRGGQVGWKQLGIIYYEGGLRSNDGVTFLPGEYAHFVPGLPDPLATYRGMSWLTPLVREIQADKAAAEHKAAFFENHATVNLAISLPKEITPEQFKRFVDLMDEQHKGAQNAYKTLYTAGGADVTVVGANMQQMDFSAVQGKGETRIANAAGVPPVLLSFSEGMQGSSLNAGNYTAAKRNFVDTTMRDLWQNWAGSLQKMDAFRPPKAKSRLWYDGRDIPFLHEDAKDRAEIQQIEAATLSSHISAGWEPDTAVEALIQDDLRRLKHTGLTSVQLVPPGTAEGSPEDEAAGDEYDALLDELRAAFGDEDEISRDRYDVRNPRGSVGGGRFRKLSDAIVALLRDADADGDPLEDFTQPQLKKAAEQLGLTEPRKRYTAKQLKLMLAQHVRGDAPGAKPVKKAPEPAGTVRAEGYAPAANTRLRVVADGKGGYIGQRQLRSDGSWHDDPSLGTGNTPKDITSRQPRGQWRMVAPPKKATPRVPAKKAAPTDDVAARLFGPDVRTEGDALEALNGLTVPELKSLAQDMNMTIPPAVKTKPKMQLHIAQQVIGHRRRTEGYAFTGEQPRPTRPAPSTVFDRLEPRPPIDAPDPESAARLRQADTVRVSDLRPGDMVPSLDPADDEPREVTHISNAAGGDLVVHYRDPRRRQGGTGAIRLEGDMEVDVASRRPTGPDPEQAARLGRDNAKIEAARQRQRDVDAARRYSFFAGEYDELVGFDANDEALIHRLESAGRRHGISEEIAPVVAAVRERREVEVENRIRAAYRARPKAPGGWVGLADLRADLADLDREEVDAALRRIARIPGVRVAPFDNTRALDQGDRDAGIHIGDSTRHMVAFRDPADRPAPEPRRLIDALLARYGITRDGEAGTTARFTPGAHEGVGGGSIRQGAPVEVVRPGFTLTRPADPALVREVEVENRIRAAYRAVAARLGKRHKSETGYTEWIGLADLRDELGEGINRHELDDALRRMNNTDPTINIVPESNQKMLTQADRDSAIIIGDQPRHAITIDDPSDRPLPRDGERIRLSKAVVEEVDEPGRGGDFDARVGRARQGASVEDLPPVRVQVDASSGADTGKWRATEVTGLSGSSAGLLSAATRRVRTSGHEANERLRFPEGRPLEEWELKLRAGYSGDALAKLEAMDADRKAKQAAIGDRDVKAIDAAMAQSHLPVDVVVWRGVRPADFGLPDGDATGFEWTDAGYVGTSARRDVAAGSFAQGATLRILAPAGTPAIAIQGGGEGEVMLGRGLRFRVVADRRTGAGPRELDVEIVSSDGGISPDLLSDLRTLDPEAARDALDLRTVPQLKPLLKSAGLPVSGRKRDLVDRLVGHLGLGESPTTGATSARPPRKAAPKPKVLKPSDLVDADFDRVAIAARASAPNTELARRTLDEAAEFFAQGGRPDSDRDTPTRLDVAAFLRERADELTDDSDLIDDPRDAPREKAFNERMALVDDDFEALNRLADALEAIEKAANRKPRKSARRSEVLAADDITRADDPDDDPGEPDEEQRARAQTRLDEVDEDAEEPEDGDYEAYRAAGMDTHPGGERLHYWWTKGPGLRKWVGSPTPWRTLRRHLLKYMSPGMATRAASKWFIEVHGYAAGSDKHRVAHGKPPRGKRIGPG